MPAVAGDRLVQRLGRERELARGEHARQGHPELRVLGIAAAYVYAAGDGDRYADFRERDGSFRGPGYTEAEAASLPAQYRVPGVVIKPVAAAVR